MMSIEWITWITGRARSEHVFTGLIEYDYYSTLLSDDTKAKTSSNTDRNETMPNRLVNEISIPQALIEAKVLTNSKRQAV